MFTGLIEDIGTIVNLQPIQQGLSLSIGSDVVTREMKWGDSIAVNGVCLTVTQFSDASFTVEAVQETLDRSTLAGLKIGDKVNLERAIRFGDRMGGHFVQGHVDGTGAILRKDKIGSAYWFDISVPADFDRYIIHKGSVAVDGISLTVARKSAGFISISVIPHTFQNTNLQYLSVNDRVNIELDMMAKYIENLLNRKDEGQKSSITEEWLREQGF